MSSGIFPRDGTVCCVCWGDIKPGDNAVDTNGVAWDVHKGMCALQSLENWAPAENDDLVIDEEFLFSQQAWSYKTFGPGKRTKGVTNHIRKELKEIEQDPNDLIEWVDVIILAFDGAWRAGFEPHEILATIKAKFKENKARTWPDWRTMGQDEAIEHRR